MCGPGQYPGLGKPTIRDISRVLREIWVWTTMMAVTYLKKWVKKYKDRWKG